MKKILLGVGAVGAVLVIAPLFAAFEAHVVNVTATIENALSVPTDPIAFGTVFPQEELYRYLSVGLSSSFLAETDADDVNYIIRQKPKCGVTENNGKFLVGPTWTGHVVPVQNLDKSWTYEINCDTDKPDGLVLGQDDTGTPNYNEQDVAGLLPSLCEYLSKHELTPDLVANPLVDNDGGLDAFHKPFTVDSLTGVLSWNDTSGRLARSESDDGDRWEIDLKVPCFGGSCAQDWADFVHGINPTENPADYTQDIANEHKVFGCNLWVEVTGVSRFSGENSGTSR